MKNAQDKNNGAGQQPAQIGEVYRGSRLEQARRAKKLKRREYDADRRPCKTPDGRKKPGPKQNTEVPSPARLERSANNFGLNVEFATVKPTPYNNTGSAHTNWEKHREKAEKDFASYGVKRI